MAWEHLVGAADQSLSRVEESRRLNPRSLSTANVVPTLRDGLVSLDGAVLSVRTMFQTLADELPREGDDRPGARPSGNGAYDQELRSAFSVVLMVQRYLDVEEPARRRRQLAVDAWHPAPRPTPLARYARGLSTPAEPPERRAPTEPLWPSPDDPVPGQPGPR